MDKLYSLVEEHMLTRHEHLYSIPNTQKKKTVILRQSSQGFMLYPSYVSSDWEKYFPVG